MFNVPIIKQKAHLPNRMAPEKSGIYENNYEK
jgi:hypothetical protein